MGKMSKINHYEFVRMWNAGVSAKEIANTFDISLTGVYRYAQIHREKCPKNRETRKNVHCRIPHNEFVKLWGEGITVRKMGKIFGVCKQRISAYAKLHRKECPRRTLGIKKSKLDILHEEFVKMWNSGVTKEKMAKHFGVSKRYIYIYAREHNDECPDVVKRTRESKVSYKEFEKMWNERISARRIAEYFGISTQHVYRYAAIHRSMGLNKRK